MNFTDVLARDESAVVHPFVSRGTAAATRLASTDKRPQARGKFLTLGQQKLFLRGVTYGTFKPNTEGMNYPDEGTVEEDFRPGWAPSGFNAIRTYTIPPRWLLDAAHKHGLLVMLGFPWEQHIDFLNDKTRARDITNRLAREARQSRGHPAILAYAIGNEIPAPMVRWLGYRRVERYLEQLLDTVKNADPEALVTYVNYPTTEYLDLSFVDFVTFNVYLESEERLSSYVARLQNIAGERPLIMSEVGLDSRRNGEQKQAEVLDWQVRTIFAGGCAGAFIFAWTDEWYRGGYEIDDWDFGVTRRNRKPKPALAAVSTAFNEIPFAKDIAWPRVSVVVCTYNGARTLADCVNGLAHLNYPDFEVVIVNDGSTDATESIARASGFRVVSTENHGLSHARNVGLEAATGEIVAFLDDDAYPDPDWLRYLAYTFVTSSHAGVGGPNLAPRNDGPIAECVAHAPGGPVHVLVTDEEAEHIPGCNLAFRRAALLEIGGFDEQFRSAGDDVDVCWRLQEKGFTLGFSPAAMVWHHRRNSVLAYWKQQIGYGKAEALLERKWPEKYNAAGHLTWGGRVYGNGHTVMLGKTWRIYYGLWGSAPFQSRYETHPGLLLSLPLMPEWYLVILAFAWLSAMGTLWQPLFLSLPLLAGALAAPVAQAVLSGSRARIAGGESGWPEISQRSLIAVLHLMQPLARLLGRLRYDLTPWRKRGIAATVNPTPRRFSLWSEQWEAAAERLQRIQDGLRAAGASVTAGHNYADWDLEVRDGTFGAVRLRMAIEEHGAGRQLVRISSWPICSTGVLVLALILLGLSLGAVVSHAWLASLTFAIVGLLLSAHVFQDCATATAAVVRVLRQLGIREGKLKPRPSSFEIYRRLVREARPYWPHLICLFVLNLVSAPLALLMPLPLKIAVDTVVGSEPLPEALQPFLPGGFSTNALLIFCASLVIAIAFLNHLQSMATSLLRTYTGEKLVLGFRAKLFRHAQRLSLSYHDSKGTTDSTYRIQYDAPAIEWILIDGVSPFVTAAFTLCGMFYIAGQIDWQLAVIAVAAAPILAVIARAYSGRLRSQWTKAYELQSSAMSIVQEVLAAVRIVKAFGQEDREHKRFLHHSTKSLWARMRITLAESGLGLLLGLTIGTGTAAVLFVGTRHVQSGVLTIGNLLIIMTYISQLYGPLETLSSMTAHIQGSLASAQRAFFLLDELPDVVERPHAAAIHKSSGTLTFDSVSFGYNKTRPVLSHVSFEIRPSTRVGIAGMTGAGKTTLLNLLTRFYDPTSGRILLDGRDLRDYKVADLRNQFAMVLQEPVLFSTSVAENISYARPEATEDEIIAAAKAANAHDFITKLPEGYDTQVGERGMRLSGGERQRISLARAFLKDTSILILDEPTSSLDMKTEADILESMERLMQGRTSFIIAHRPSLLTNCDVLLFIQQGRLFTVTSGIPAALDRLTTGKATVGVAEPAA